MDNDKLRYRCMIWDILYSELLGDMSIDVLGGVLVILLLFALNFELSFRLKVL